MPALPPTAKRGARKASPRGLPDEVKQNKLQESGRVARFDEKSIKKRENADLEMVLHILS